MQRGSIHGLGKDRRFPGEAAAEGLVSWLNDGKTRDGDRERITELLDCLIELLSCLATLRGRFRQLVDDDDFRRRLDALEANVNDKLSRYTMRPLLLGEFDTFGLEAAYEPLGKATIEEWWAFEKIQDLGVRGHLGRLRRCEWCRRWLFARFPSRSRFCSGTDCYERAYRKTPKYRKRRKVYSRDYYNRNFKSVRSAPKAQRKGRRKHGKRT